MNIKELNKILSQHGIEPVKLNGDVKLLRNNEGHLNLYPERIKRKKYAGASVGSIHFRYAPFSVKGPTPSPTVLSVGIYISDQSKYKELCTELFLHDVFDKTSVGTLIDGGWR